MNKTIYIRDDDQQLWEAAVRMAKARGVSTASFLLSLVGREVNLAEFFGEESS